MARRDLFHYPVVDPDAADSPRCVYLCGNSLGLQPVNVGKYVNEELQRSTLCIHTQHTYTQKV